MLEFRIEADTFMRHMNRVLVGTMLEVAGGGAAAWRTSRALLEGRPRARRAARRRRTGSTWRGVNLLVRLTFPRKLGKAP